ncbi:MAG TPA: hypothetical protein DCQ64_24835, partial [Candidatus Rokubacteria bacterium]|nr:hypothetical protein [Candidatus Rokubacteria bacterium]
MRTLPSRTASAPTKAAPPRSAARWSSGHPRAGPPRRPGRGDSRRRSLVRGLRPRRPARRARAGLWGGGRCRRDLPEMTGRGVMG